MAMAYNPGMLLLLHSVVLAAVSMVVAPALPPSPCPRVFRYELDDVEGWIGVVTAPAPNSNKPLTVKVELSVAAALPTKYAGKLSLLDDKDTVGAGILAGTIQDIDYRVLFPLPKPFPVVTRVLANENLICAGPSVKGRVVTKISLEHTLYPVAQTLTVLEPKRDRPNQIPHNSDPSDDSHPTRPPPRQDQDPYDTNTYNSRPTRPPPRRDPDLYITDTYNSHPTRPAPSREPDDVPFWTAAPEPPVRKPSRTRPKITSSGDDCGRPLVPNQLVANGHNTARGEWPWLAALYRLNDKGGQDFHCSGSLINEKTILTAGHCIWVREREELGPDLLTVVLGKYNLRRLGESHNQILEVGSTHVHPDYRPLQYSADIAVLILRVPAVYSVYVRPVCLWSGPTNLERIIGKVGTVVGWGRDELGNTVTPTPRVARMPIVSTETCIKSKEDFLYFTSERTFCAGFRNGTGPCNGDSGGGLVVPFSSEGETRWFLRGIVSLSLQDRETRRCDLNEFIVYTDVPKFGSWIRRFM